MSATTLDKLVYMANQIAREFAGQHPRDPAQATYDHLWHFWDHRMCAMIIDHLSAGGEGLNDIAREAVVRLERARGDPSPVTKATEFNSSPAGGDDDLMSDAG